MPRDPASHRDNNLDAVRLVAALTVIVGHAWPLTGLGGPPRVAGIPIFTLAVFVFFAVSGFLIATSWNRNPDVRAFLARRILRIFPALILVVLVTTFVIGPLATALGPGAYLADPGSWFYLTNITLVPAYELPGVFADHPRTAVNGSLWTLGPEFACYLGVLVVGLVLSRVPRAAPVAFGLLGLGLAVVALVTGSVVASAAVFFAIGAVVATTVRRVPLWLGGALLVVWVVVGSVHPPLSLPLAWIAVPAAVLAFGLRSAPVVRRAGRFGDFSYGVYLWGYPVQQLVYGAAPELPLWADILVVAVVTGAIAVLSWHLVERRALAVARAYRAQAMRRTGGSPAA